MSRSTTRIQNLTLVTELADNDVLPIGPASGDRAKGITNENFQKQFTKLLDPITVNNNFTLTNDESGKFIIFDVAGTATLDIPDGLNIGLNTAFTNIGAGGMALNFTGSETFRGSLILADNDGYGVASKITATIWQLSER